MEDFLFGCCGRQSSKEEGFGLAEGTWWLTESNVVFVLVLVLLELELGTFFGIHFHITVVLGDAILLNHPDLLDEVLELYEVFHILLLEGGWNILDEECLW